MPPCANPLLLGALLAGTTNRIRIDFSTTEVMIVDFIQKDQDARLEMYRLLGKEFGLPLVETTEV
jgi:hypothetical protein